MCNKKALAVRKSFLRYNKLRNTSSSIAVFFGYILLCMRPQKGSLSLSFLLLITQHFYNLQRI